MTVVELRLDSLHGFFFPVAGNGGADRELGLASRREEWWVRTEMVVGLGLGERMRGRGFGGGEAEERSGFHW